MPEPVIEPPSCAKCGRGITVDDGCEWPEDGMCWACMYAENEELKDIIAGMQDPESVGNLAWLAGQMEKRALKAEAALASAVTGQHVCTERCVSELEELCDREIDRANQNARDLAKLRDACTRAGFGIMETSGDWSLHDVSPRAKELDQQTLDVINKNVELEAAYRELIEIVSPVADYDPMDFAKAVDKFKKSFAVHQESYMPPEL